MAYDEDLADRIRVAVGRSVNATGLVTEKRMFGGLAFLLRGHMAVAASPQGGGPASAAARRGRGGGSGQGGVMVRVDPGHTESLLEEPHTGPMVMRGREMDGWLRVEATGVQADE